MASRYDALTVRESNGKNYFTKIGAMFENKSGAGFTLMLDAVPASVDGQYRIILAVPKPREDTAPRSNPGGNSSRRRDEPTRDDLDDEIPF